MAANKCEKDGEHNFVIVVEKVIMPTTPGTNLHAAQTGYERVTRAVCVP